MQLCVQPNSDMKPHLREISPGFPLGGVGIERQQALSRGELQHESVQVAELVVVEELVHHEGPLNLLKM